RLRASRAARETVNLPAPIERRVGAPADPSERKQLRVELAGLREAEKDPAGLFGALSRAFQEDPNDSALRARLSKAADAARTYPELAQLYEDELPRIAEPKDAAALLLHLPAL